MTAVSFTNPPPPPHHHPPLPPHSAERRPPPLPLRSNLSALVTAAAAARTSPTATPVPRQTPDSHVQHQQQQQQQHQPTTQLPKASHSATMIGRDAHPPVARDDAANGYVLVDGANPLGLANGSSASSRENLRLNGNGNGSGTHSHHHHHHHHHPLYPAGGPSTPTTALSRQNSPSSNASSITPIGESSAELLRQTLNVAGAPSATPKPNHHHHHQKSSPRRKQLPGLLPPSRVLTPAGSAEDSGTESPDQQTPGELEKVRHGFADEYNSEAYLAVLEQVFYMYYTDKRHETGGNPKEDGKTFHLQEWRMKDRLKTVSAGLVLCLNIGVDPPDIVKTNPCAKLESWIDTSAHPAAKALEQAGKNLQQQYETLSIRTRYKQHLDPSVEDTKKICCSLRRTAKDERILFHYNGHGVPKPTASGEIWVFNKNFTQYIPISLYDLQSWLGAPSLFVYDCSDAGNILSNFTRFIEKHEAENAEAKAKDSNAPVTSYNDCIQLAACSSKETLPMNPDLPADLFTCCLTTPIEIAIRFFVLQNPLPSQLSADHAMKIPGRLQERRTPLGELNWIFTAITDTIAWNTLPRPLFKRLFRQDLMVAALFRNFLLSQRIMRVHQCHPQSSPALPDTHHHPLWNSWDLAVEMVLAQLPALKKAAMGGPAYEYQNSSFFTEQLTAFEVYLSQGALDRKPPDQLPIVLQVLLSQVHRLRALILLSKFLDLGPWAVNLALSIGIFPYVLKLLQSAAQELKPVMVFIWARILAVDPSCQTDLLKDNGYSYFVQILSPASGIPVGNASEHRAMCAFILAMFCRGFHQGQVVCMPPNVMGACLAHLEDENPLLRQWACLCLSQLWGDFIDAKWQGIREEAHIKLCDLLSDNVPEVRAASLFALTTFFGGMEVNEEATKIEHTVTGALLCTTADGSNMVRKELVIYLSMFVTRYKNKFLVTAFEQMLHERDDFPRWSRANGMDGLRPSALPTERHHNRVFSGPGALEANDSFPQGKKDTLGGISENTVFSSVWQVLLMLSADPYLEVAQAASIVVDHIHLTLLRSPLGSRAQEVAQEISRDNPRRFVLTIPSNAASESKRAASPGPNSISKAEGYLSTSLRRSASIAASIRQLALAYASGDTTPVNSTPTTPKSTKGSWLSNGGERTLEWNQPPDANDPRHSTAGYQPAKPPTMRNFHPKMSDGKPSLPLKSHFLEWSIEYFREPQMKPNEADEPGSVDYNQRLWRRTRNDRIIIETQAQKDRAVSSKWDHNMSVFNNGNLPMRLLFHQFESYLVSADDKDGVSVWDWERGVKTNNFANGNPDGTKITEIKFLNEDDVALLMVGSGDGVVKIYRNYESNGGAELVSSWRALTDLLPSRRSSGLVAEWQQGRGTMLVGGDVKVIRVWDAPREMCLSDIPARSGSCITSLTSEQVAGNFIVAGFGDGAIRVYDRRIGFRESMVMRWKVHDSWVVNVHMQRGGTRELVSGSATGEVKLWDIRMGAPAASFLGHTKGMRSLSIHEHAPIVATGSTWHDVKLWNISTTPPEMPLSTIKPYSSFLHQNRSNPVSGLAFHPHRMMLACSGVGDSHISIYACDSAGV